MSWLAAATGENHTLSLYEIKHTVFLHFLHFSESLFAKNHSVGKVFLYFYENKKGLYRRQTLGLNILSLYEDH